MGENMNEFKFLWKNLKKSFYQHTRDSETEYFIKNNAPQLCLGDHRPKNEKKKCKISKAEK